MYSRPKRSTATEISYFEDSSGDDDQESYVASSSDEDTPQQYRKIRSGMFNRQLY